MAEITVNALHKSFGAFTAVRDSSFTIADGQFFCLLGPSGCGKTTTLRMIAGLELPTSGRILLDGRDVTRAPAGARDIAFVFQLFALYPHMTVRQNMAFPLRNQGVPKAQIVQRVEEAARILRIDGLLDRGVGGLSGGDRQRVALGRAIVRQPKAFLMDEPLGALDAEFRHVMCGELRALHDRLRATTVYVTHDQQEAMSMADMIAVMNQGEIEQLAPPQEIYDRPATLFVADFIGSPAMSLLPFHAGAERGATQLPFHGQALTVPALHEEVPLCDLVLGVRPEHVRLAETGILRGRVFGTEFLGTTQIVSVETPHGMARARMPGAYPVSTGETVGLTFLPDRLSLFDRRTGRALKTAWSEARPTATAARRQGAAHG